MIWFLFALTLGISSVQDHPQERPPIPDDSIEVTVIGCLNGRALRAADLREADVQSGPDVRGRTFRLAGKKDVMELVKRHNKQLVEVTGIIKRSALDDRGVKVGRQVEISGGLPVAGRGIPSAADNVPVLDVSSVRMRSASCGGG
ncbi:MAG TPA: hypothetical protein VD833_13075 [Vicinamibacterales bacterium]|nr:hypothetical protein [Vicinamibacterales bacterium]